MSWKAVLAMALVAGCYQPDIGACRYACATDGTCPSGLACNDQKRCAASASDRCDDRDAGDDAPDDGGGIDVPDCGWRASNVNPCALDALASTIVVSPTGPAMINADANSATFVPDQPGATFVKVAQANGGDMVWVLVAKQIVITSQLSISSRLPIVFLTNEEMHIDANVTWNPPIVAGPGFLCPGDGGNGGDDGSAGGGGGGGYGTALNSSGAPGGDGANNGPQGTGGVAFGAEDLRPLALGCNGGRGGSNGGRAGAGGGALQLSSHGALTIKGDINMPGGGGGFGTTGAGGGGGGAGGAILIEAHEITLDGSPALCANGGGGGATGSLASSGQDGLCLAAPAFGGMSSNGDGAIGGPGAYRNTDAVAGQKPILAQYGGSGGGGAVGRIRINGTVTITSAIVTPAYTTGSEP